MALGNKYRYKKPNKIKIKSLALTSSIELYQSFGENKVLICGEWTNVDSNMKLLMLELFGIVAFKFQSAFFAEQEPFEFGA